MKVIPCELKTNEIVQRAAGMTDKRLSDRYFYNPAEQELATAQPAQAPEAGRAHYGVADLCLHRFYGVIERPMIATGRS